MNGDFQPTQRARIIAISDAVPLSQSPDSVIAFNADTLSVEDGTQDVRVSSSPQCVSDSNTVALSSLRHLSAPHCTAKKPAIIVMNPYIKVTPSASNTPEHEHPQLRKRRLFIEKYLKQANEYVNNQRRQNNSQQSMQYPTSHSIMESHTSAWKIYCETQTWRNSWQQLASDKRHERNEKTTNPLRPRLFLFPICSTGINQQSLQRHQSNISESTSQPMYHTGVWELNNGITEISGEGGSGKSQICLSLCVTSVMMTSTNNHNGCINMNNHQYSALFVSMGEGTRSITVARRLEQIVQSRLGESCTNKQVKHFLSRIGLVSLRNEEEFIEFVEKDLPNIMEYKNTQHCQLRRQQQYHQQQQRQQRIALIVFDGIAGFFRFSDPLFQQFQKSNSTFHQQRGHRLLYISSKLRRLSDLYDVPIIITNQVTASIKPDSNPSICAATGMQNIMPALGLAWSNCVSARFILQRKKDMLMTGVCRDNVQGNTKRNNIWTRVRAARVLQSVNLPKNQEVRFVIEKGGAIAVE